MQFDLTLPGYNYLGPFNKLNKGKPTNKSDKAAFKHDVAYGRLQRKGINPYWTFNDADRDFINEVGTDWGGKIGKSVFQLKKKAAEYGIINSHSQDPIYVTPVKQRRLLPPTISPQKRRELPPPSFRILQRNTMGETKADGLGSGQNGNLTETPVDQVVNVTRGPPNYTFASLPFIEQVSFDGRPAYCLDICYRMTSPYDCKVSEGLQDLNTATPGTANAIYGVVDSADGVTTKARWFDLYASQYKYYHVVSARWHLTFENMSTSPMWLHQMYQSDTPPPVGADNEDILCWPGVYSHYIGPAARTLGSGSGIILHLETPAQGTQDNVATPAPSFSGNYNSSNHVNHPVSSIIKISGDYAPGDFNREIRLDNEVENWSLVTTNPALPEKLLFRLKGINESLGDTQNQNYGQNLSYRYMFTVEYLVEFRELQDGLRYPVNKQPASVTIRNDPKSAG